MIMLIDLVSDSGEAKSTETEELASLPGFHRSRWWVKDVKHFIAGQDECLIMQLHMQAGAMVRLH